MSEIDIEHPIQIPEYTYNSWTIHDSILQDKQTNYKDFFKNFMLKNVPCVIKNVIYDWECASKWVKNDGIDFNYLIKAYGDLEAPVADCKNIEFNSQCKCNMSIIEYLNYLKGRDRDKILYLKDWHLRRIRPDDLFYETPSYFALDWLNEFALDNKEDDFMFVYIGPSKSWTPLHEDVYCSYSWSVNIVGRKKWTLFPPGEEHKLKDSLGNLPLLFECEKYNDIKHFEIIQDAGDAMFVPSGWYHQVTNELDTISINHNWINGCNIEMVWKAMQKSLSEIETQIGEFKDTPEFPTECQIILKSLFGMDCEYFIFFLCYIAKKRIRQLQHNIHTVQGKYKLGKNIIKFDLQNLLKVMNLIYLHPIYQNKNILSANVEADFIDTRKLILDLYSENKL